MVALRAERRVFLWRIWPKTAPGDAAANGKTATLDEIVSILEGEYSAKKARVYLRGSRILDDEDPDVDHKNQLFIADIKRDKVANTATILVCRGDPETVSPAFVNAQDSKVRVAHPGAKEAPGWSAHLVVSLGEEGGSHRACFEQMAHVSSALVLLAIDRILSRALAGNPTYRYEVSLRKAGKTKIEWRPYRPAFDVSRVPSEKLVSDLDEGELSSITLTKARSYYAGIGVKDIIKRQEEKVVISFRPVGKSRLQSTIADILEKAKSEKFESVTFHLEKLPGNQTNQPTISLAASDAMEELYVRARRLTGFENVLEQCYSEVCAEIANKMAAIVNDQAGW